MVTPCTSADKALDNCLTADERKEIYETTMITISLALLEKNQQADSMQQVAVATGINS